MCFKPINFFKRAVSFKIVLYQALETCVLISLGDFIAQHGFEEDKYSVRRTGMFSLLGFFLIGPSVSVWIQCLDAIFKSKNKKQRRKNALKKMLVDQLVFAPSMLAITTTLLIDEENRKTAYFDILKRNYQVWPSIQLANFYFTPMKHQVLVTQICGLFWNVYIAWRMHNH